MSWFELPDPGPLSPPPFGDAIAARAWLSLQPQAQPVQMQSVLQAAIQAVDASDLPPAGRLDILDALRGAVILAQSAIEPRYTRKPLPMMEGEARVFAASRELWRTLAIAYLRTAQQLPPPEMLRSLHRAAVALRLEQFACFLAAHAVPPDLLGLLYAILTSAERAGLQRTPLVDPDYKHMGESNIAGQVAWAFLLQFIDPYRLSLAQLAVANRAFSRWRELAGFQSFPDDDPKARALPLAALLGESGLAEDGPRWLDVRPVARKIRKRSEALLAGEAPEALKLGRELSNTACLRLMHYLEAALRPTAAETSDDEVGKLELVFGHENIYCILAGRQLNPAALDSSSKSMSHQRMAVFGFDNLVNNPTAVKRIEVPSETWQACEQGIERAPEIGSRLVAPCLVAERRSAGGEARLGVLTGLKARLDGNLQAQVQWYRQPAAAVWFQTGNVAAGKGVRIPAFVLGDGKVLSLVLPAAAGVRPESRLFLEDSPVAQVKLGTVQERGSDFVRYAVGEK